MKAKTIKKVIFEKATDWIASIEDEKLQKLIKRDLIVTGGCIASMLLQEKVNDYDFYFKTLETTEALIDYYIGEFKISHGNSYDLTKIPVGPKDENGNILEIMRYKIRVKSTGAAEAQHDDPTILDEDILEPEATQKTKEKYKPIHLSANAITLSGQVQVVIRFWGDIDTIHTNYDFVHCTNSYDFETKQLNLRAEALECLLTKELRYMGSKYPLCSIIRTRKFVKREWTCNAGQYLKMCLQLNKIDLHNLEELEEQLIGVDAFYFSIAIEHIKKMQERDPDFKITNPYLFKLIDRIF